MAIGKKILRYLEKEGSTNTFRLARELALDRNKILEAVQDLEDKKAVESHAGVIKFLRFPEKKKAVAKKPPVEVKKHIKKKKRRVKRKVTKALGILQSENKDLKGKISELEETIKTLEEKAKAPPKVITKTIIKKVPAKAKKKLQKPKLQKPKLIKLRLIKPKLILKKRYKYIARARKLLRKHKKIKHLKAKTKKLHKDWFKKLRKFKRSKLKKKKPVKHSSRLAKLKLK